MPARITHEQRACKQTGERQYDAEIKRIGPQPKIRRDPTCEKRGESHRKITGKFIQAHGQAALFLAHEIDFHHHGARPREALIEAEQNIRRDNPIPTRRVHEHERHGHAEEPAEHEQSFSAETIRQRAGEIIRERFDEAENHNERKDRGLRGEVKFRFGNLRQNRALHAHHAADKGIDEHEQRELSPIFFQAELNCFRAHEALLAFCSGCAVACFQ